MSTDREASERDALEELEKGLERVAEGYRDAFAAAEDEQTLREVNARYVGPQGELTRLLKLIPRIPAERRKDLGRRANELKGEVNQAFEEALQDLARARREAELSGAPIDVTLPGRGLRPGKAHPVTRVTDQLLDVFTSLGFDVADGPQIDFHEHNFDKLGFPPDHPATDMQDSFYIRAGTPGGGKRASGNEAAGREGSPREDVETTAATMLRTHTSTIQIREMLERRPPLAIVSPGAVYRRDDDATHSPMFFQLEGLLVDEDVSYAHLKGVLTLFVRRVFGEQVPVRFRPSYFPFVEPGGEVDIGCVFCKPWEGDRERTAACRVCKATGWLEILGCGMVHPAVFENVGYDAERWSGFAFGMGIDRIAMLKYGVPNIRLLYENDVRFLDQL